jgi:hypothetical protein
MYVNHIARKSRDEKHKEDTSKNANYSSLYTVNNGPRPLSIDKGLARHK